MLKRNERGRLSLDNLSLQIMLGDLFAECKNETEVEWFKEILCDTAEGIAEERLEEIEIDGE